MALSDEELDELGKAPKRSRTDEGSVEERSVDDLLKLKNYQEAAAAQAGAPYGMRIAKIRFPGTT
jgi:hypothetical protein